MSLLRTLRAYSTKLPKAESKKSATPQRSRGPRNDRRDWVGEQSRDQNGDPGMMNVMKMIGAFTNYLESVTRRFESSNSHTQSYKEITPNVSDMCVKNGTHA